MQISISRRRLISLLPMFPAAKMLLSQESQQAATFTADVNVVNVLATVHDKEGHVVSGLNKENFTLQEDGRPQTIRYFSKETNLPLTLGLLVDTSRSQYNVIEAERSASYSFLEHVLREKQDQAFILHFDHDVELLQDLTPSREKLNKALHDLNVNQDKPQMQRRGGGGAGGQGGARGRFGTLLYDAVYLTGGDELMKKQKGRKAAIILSNGVDRGSKVSISQAIEAAQRSDTLVYSIYFASNEGFGRGFGGPGLGRGGLGRGGGMGRGGGRYPQQEHIDGKQVLRRISKETGGGYFEVSKKETVEKIYEQIQEELRNQYNLGYVSDKTASEGGYRTISLSVDKKNLIAQAREGYYPVPPSSEGK